MRRSVLSLAALAIALPLAANAPGAGPADPLFRLVPPDVGLALAVENLRDHSREIAASPLAGKLRRLPGVASWIGSEPVRGVRRVVGEVEDALGWKPGSIREELFGDAVVLALRAGPPEAPENSRGVLLGRARDREMLERLIRAMDQFQTDNGELTSVVRKPHGAGSYTTRTYAQAGRPAESYATFDDGVFAWSNSEDLIRAVLDRKAAGGPALADDPGFRAVRQAMPERILLSLYVSPKILDAVLPDKQRKETSTQDRAIGLFARYVSALRFAGVGFAWEDGIAIHTHEALDPGRLDEWLRGWLTRPSRPGPSLFPLPATALAACVIDCDFAAVRDAAWGLVPESDRAWYRNLKTALKGLLLGQDLDADILPRLGPGLLITVGAPIPIESRVRLPITATIEVRPGPDGPGPGPAIENAIRTGLSIYALDPAQKASGFRVEDRVLGAARVLVLAGTNRTLFALATRGDRIVVGNVAETVARIGPDPSASSLEALRVENFPDASTFAVVDLARVATAIQTHRRPLAERIAARGKRGVEAVGKDLDELVAAADLFRAATFTSTAGRDAASIHRIFRLIPR